MKKIKITTDFKNPTKVLNNFNFLDDDRKIIFDGVYVEPYTLMIIYIYTNIQQLNILTQTDIKNYLRKFGYFIEEKEINLILLNLINNIIDDINNHLVNIDKNNFTITYTNKNNNIIFYPKPLVNIFYNNFITFKVYLKDNINSVHFIKIPFYKELSYIKMRNKARMKYINIKSLDNNIYKDTRAQLFIK